MANETPQTDAFIAGFINRPAIQSRYPTETEWSEFARQFERVLIAEQEAHKTCNELWKLSECELTRAREALTTIAAFDDDGATTHWKQTGSWSKFDEPVSARIARIALAARGK